MFALIETTFFGVTTSPYLRPNEQYRKSA